MKTWQMIKELTENPSKRFTYDAATKGSYITIEGGRPVWRGKGQCGQRLIVFIDDEWEEVKQPVNFMEAVASGKRIRVEHELTNNDAELKKTSLLDDFLGKLNSYLSSEIKEILTNGEFYTED